jgi:hypothetical protein
VRDDVAGSVRRRAAARKAIQTERTEVHLANGAGRRVDGDDERVVGTPAALDLSYARRTTTTPGSGVGATAPRIVNGFSDEVA